MKNHLEKRSEKTFVVMNDYYYNHGIFYYSPKETKRIHLDNLKHKREGRDFKPYLRQLIGMDSELGNKRLYTKIINMRIKGEL